VPDVARIDQVSVAELSVALLRKYFGARQGGVFDPSSRAEGNLSINSTLKNAKVLFSKASRAYILEALKIPWDAIEGFMDHPLLKTPAGTPDMVDGEAWAAMATAADARGDELGLINWILRTTALRTIELLAARPSWLLEMGGKTWLDIRDRAAEGFLIKGGTTAGLVPLLPGLATVLKGRSQNSWLVGEGLSADGREKLLRVAHNAFVKEYLGGVGEKVQGNHRLRDFVGQIVYTLYGETRARDALRHANARTTLAHYARYTPTVPDKARVDLAAWE
jgi:integrase